MTAYRFDELKFDMFDFVQGKLGNDAAPLMQQANVEECLYEYSIAIANVYMHLEGRLKDDFLDFWRERRSMLPAP